MTDITQQSETATSFSPDLLADTVRTLELPQVLEEVSSHASSAPGRLKLLGARPSEEIEAIRAGLELVVELRETIGLRGKFGLNSLVPMEEIFSKLGNPAVILDVDQILAVRDLLDTAESIWHRLDTLEERFTRLREKAERFVILDVLQGRINSVLDEKGMVRETASRRLTAIRQRKRSLKKRIYRELEMVVTNRDLSRVVQEDYVTLRNDRFVILLRPEFKGVLAGIVHDHSRSGASVYVEPLGVVELNNQVAGLLDEEREEIRRIFRELTEEIRGSLAEISRNYDLLADLDAFQARALYARETDAVAPELVDKGYAIFGARHPLLLAAKDRDVVPMDIVQDHSTSATIISGANMGGKTVALKIAGLFPLMTRCAILLPAREGTKIRPFLRVMADIGDEQDVRSHRSSFSGHMQRIKAILDTAVGEDLVLLDELGGATDPEEGSALAMAVLDELIQRRVRVVVTTHLTHLKAYGMGRSEVKNVSVEFHPQTLQPTYRLLYDLPGESHAIATAERIGLPGRVIAGARGYGDAAAGGSTRLLSRLKEQLAQAETQRKELEDKQRELELELERIRASRDEIVEEFRKKARDMMNKATKEIRDLQRALKSGKVARGREAKTVLAETKAFVEETLETSLEREMPTVTPGTRVRLETLEKEGVVVGLPERGKVEVAVGNMKMRADLEDLTILEQQPEKKSSSKNGRFTIDIAFARPRREVNVIGLRVDDALPVVDRAVDEASLGGLSTITIIHGKGTGRLKEAVRDHLVRHALVQGVRGGDTHGGGEGVTVVDLK